MEINTNHWDEWLNRRQPGRNITEVGYDYLRNGHQLRIARGSRLAQLLVLPAFEANVSYEIFRTYIQPEQRKEYHLLKTVWDFHTDLARWRETKPSELVPSFSYLTVPLDEKFAMSAIEGLQNNVPSIIDVSEPIIGMDGAFYELLLGDAFLSVHYRWWEAPDAWRPLHTTFFETIAQFETQLAQASTNDT